MTAEETQQFIKGGIWQSITTELRPSITKNTAGDIQPFYLTRKFEYGDSNYFACSIINYADAIGNVPLVNIEIKGHLAWQGPHQLIEGAYKVDYVADTAYEITPLHQGFADAVNRFPSPDIQPWAINTTQDVKAKAFPVFGLNAGEIYVDYDLIYIYNNMLFNGSKNVDGRAFDKPENRPTNLQLPLIRI